MSQIIAPSQEALAKIEAPRLAYPVAVEERFGVNRAQWKALVEAIFPNATTPDSVVLALSYCQARKIDVFKRVVHIVPIWSSERKCLVDTVWPGIGELRTTAARTGLYAGRDAALFGPDRSMRLGDQEATFPEWCQLTLYRIVGGVRCPFVGPKVYWLESYATKRRDNDAPNEMWATRPIGQIEKCAEAAALRAAFPEEIGNDYIPEEIEGNRRRVVENTADPRVVAVAADLAAMRAEHDAKKAAAKPTQPDTVNDGSSNTAAPRDPEATIAPPRVEGTNEGARAGEADGNSPKPSPPAVTSTPPTPSRRLGIGDANAEPPADWKPGEATKKPWTRPN